jgi:outer membrane protein assembly factor BamB
LYALDTESGKEMWRYDLGVPITSSPAISGNTVYIGAYDGSIYAFTQISNLPPGSD